MDRIATVRARDIPDNAQLHATSCTRHARGSDGRRAFFGLEVQPGDTTVVGYFYCGALSPASEAGIAIGDRIVRLRGCPAANSAELNVLIDETSPDTVVFVEVERPGLARTQPVAIRVRGQKPSGNNRPGRSPGRNGCTLTAG